MKGMEALTPFSSLTFIQPGGPGRIRLSRLYPVVIRATNLEDAYGGGPEAISFLTVPGQDLVSYGLTGMQPGTFANPLSSV